jgi:hypothetical protein
MNQTKLTCFQLLTDQQYNNEYLLQDILVEATSIAPIKIQSIIHQETKQGCAVPETLSDSGQPTFALSTFVLIE